MPESDLELLTRAAQQSGQIASKYWRSDNEVWDKGNDDPVSAADLACPPNKIHQLQIEQGELTVTDLQKFIAKMPEDSCLGIYQSDLNYEEAKRIQKSALNSHLDVYGKTLPGQELFEAEEIYPSWIE